MKKNSNNEGCPSLDRMGVVSHFGKFKYTLLFAVMLMVGAPLRAQQSVTLVLWLTNGHQARVELYTKPTVNITNESVVVKSPFITMTYAASAVKRFTYENVVDAIESAKGSAETGTVRQDGESLFFSGSHDATSVTLFTSDGKQMPVTAIAAEGGLRIALQSIPKGVYILNVKGQPCKFEKR